MKKTTPKYNGAYPLAAELILASRLTKQSKIFAAAVRRACMSTFRAIAKSSAVTNPNNDASNGKDVGVAFVAGESISPALVKKVNKYIKKNYGSNWSNIPREKQTKIIKQAIGQIAEPKPIATKSTIQKMMSYGEYGAVPVHIISGVEKEIASTYAKSYAAEAGASAGSALSTITKNAAKVQDVIEAGDFGLTPEYFGAHYEKYTVKGEKLVDLVTGKEVTADTAGAVAPEIITIADPLLNLSVISSAPAMDAIKTDVVNNVEQNFQLIVKAAEGKRLAPGVELSPEDAADLISVDIYKDNPELREATDAWVEQNMQRIKNMNADALKRGIKVTQQAVKEGRSPTWLEEQLQKEMEIPARRASTIARTATSNAAWNVDYAQAKNDGLSIYRWRGMLDERERQEHKKREGVAFDPQHPPTDGNPGQPINCRCWAEWLFENSDVEAAQNEIAARNRS